MMEFFTLTRSCSPRNNRCLCHNFMIPRKKMRTHANRTCHGGWVLFARSRTLCTKYIQECKNYSWFSYPMVPCRSGRTFNLEHFPIQSTEFPLIFRPLDSISTSNKMVGIFFQSAHLWTLKNCTNILRQRKFIINIRTSADRTEDTAPWPFRILFWKIP